MSRVSYVYVFAVDTGNGLTAPCKVGVSQAPKRRLKEHQTWSPYPISLVGAFQVPSQQIALAVERAFHSVHADDRTNGEWFAREPMECVQGVALALRELLHSMGWEIDTINEAVLLAAKEGETATL